LSATGLADSVAVPQAVVQSSTQSTLAKTATSSTATATVTNPTPPATAYTPAQTQNAYGFSQLLSQGNNGAGQTIAIVDAYNDPNIVNDLATFDAQYGLSGTTASGVAQFLMVLNQNGTQGSLPQADPSGGWEAEEALDVEWAHAMAPGAKIELVEANSANLSDLFSAVQTAAGTKGVSVVSMSWGGAEFPNESSYDSIFSQHPNVAFVAASGDSGAGTIYPAVSPYVIAVGGTTLPSSGGTAQPAQQTG
jgi:subtilase family serine protease